MVKKIRTSLVLPSMKWREFSVEVARERGNKKMSEVMEWLIDLYLEDKKRRQNF